jgi:hypothetical protein
MKTDGKQFSNLITQIRMEKRSYTYVAVKEYCFLSILEPTTFKYIFLKAIQMKSSIVKRENDFYLPICHQTFAYLKLTLIFIVVILLLQNKNNFKMRLFLNRSFMLVLNCNLGVVHKISKSK